LKGMAETVFRKNKDHLQVSMYGLDVLLSKGVKNMLQKSWAPAFREHIFLKINEQRFAVLYSDTASRPNFPVNVWVSLEMLKELFDLTDEELLVKVLQNLYRDLPATEQNRCQTRLGEYVESEADHITYRLKREQVEEHLKKVGELLFDLHEAYKDDDRINGLKSYRHVGRVLMEQYDIKADGDTTEIEPKANKDINSGSLQNPADDEATYRKKGKKESKGCMFSTCRKPARMIRRFS